MLQRAELVAPLHNAPHMSRPPNILLVVADCARSDRWLGRDRATKTPHLDRLAAAGVALPTTIVEKSCTTPSFSTLLTGRYSPRHGVHLVWGYRLPDSVPMISEAFARRGYHTYAEVSGPLLPEMGLARGFESYEYRAPCDYLHTAWGDRLIERLRGGHYVGPWLILLHLWELHPHRCVPDAFRDAQFGRDEYEQAVSALDSQLARLFAAAGDETIIAFTGDHGEKTRFETYAPGTAVDYARKLLGVDDADGMAPYEIASWAGPSVLQDLYSQSAPLISKLRLSELRARPRFGWWAKLRDRLRLLRLTPWIYLSDLLSLGKPLKLTEMIKRRGLLDEQQARGKVERFKRAVGQKNLLDMHLRMWINSYKRNMDEGHLIHVYDYLVKVPLVLHAPGRLPGGVVRHEMVRQPDLLPTLFELCGFDRAELGEIDGVSFSPLLRGEEYESPPAYLSVSGTPLDLELRGVRTERYKFTYGPHNPDLPAELYDLRFDPAETRNMAAQHIDLCEQMRETADAIAAAGTLAEAQAVPLAAEESAKVQAQLRSLGYVE